MPYAEKSQKQHMENAEFRMQNAELGFCGEFTIEKWFAKYFASANHFL